MRTSVQELVVQPAPKVSVCVITYNHKNYIRACMESIVAQETDFEYEVIVGDDASTDGTTEIVRDYARRYPHLIRPVIHERNLGGCDNYRVIHRLARGEYVAHLDGDDRWFQGKLQKQVMFLDNNPDCSAVYTNAWVESAAGNRMGKFSDGIPTKFDLQYLVKDGNFLFASSTMYRNKHRKSIIPDQGDFVDYLVHVRLARLGLLGFISENLGVYTYNTSTSTIGLRRNHVRNLIWRALTETGDSDPPSVLDVRPVVRYASQVIANEIIRLRLGAAIHWTQKTLQTCESKRAVVLSLSLSVPLVVFAKVTRRISRVFRSDKVVRIFFEKYRT